MIFETTRSKLMLKPIYMLWLTLVVLCFEINRFLVYSVSRDDKPGKPKCLACQISAMNPIQLCCLTIWVLILLWLVSRCWLCCVCWIYYRWITLFFSYIILEDQFAYVKSCFSLYRINCFNIVEGIFIHSKEYECLGMLHVFICLA
jgi:hypothetical protein